MELTKVDNIIFEDIDPGDAPDYCDAFIASADYNGVPMSESEIDELDSDFVHEKLMENLY